MIRDKKEAKVDYDYDEVTGIQMHFETVLEELINATKETSEMKEEIDRLESIARWEAAGKISKTMSNALRAVGVPKDIVRMALDWYGMQEGKQINYKKLDSLLAGPKIQEVKDDEEEDLD